MKLFVDKSIAQISFMLAEL